MMLLIASTFASEAQDAMANGVAEWVEGGLALSDFATSSDLFDKEWHFGACQMAALGFAQHAAANPASRDADLARMDLCITFLLGEGRAFDQGSWGEDPLDVLDGTRGHMAWLGYTNLVLSAHRALAPESRWADLNDKMTEAIARRVAAEPCMIPETYAGERYPVDTAAGIASIGLHDRVTGADHGALLRRWTARLKQDWVRDGLVVQSVSANGTPTDAPRGSGTFLAAWFLGWWDGALAAELYAGGRTAVYQETLGFGAMREYLPGQDGRGDIDSGPIVGGLGVSSTGFAIGAARAAGDARTAAMLTRTAEFVGRPQDVGGVRHWATGVALGGAPLADAILFAMMTTPPRL